MCKSMAFLLPLLLVGIVHGYVFGGRFYAPCQHDGQCQATLRCRLYKCQLPGNINEACKTQSDCQFGLSCYNNYCSQPHQQQGYGGRQSLSTYSNVGQQQYNGGVSRVSAYRTSCVDSSQCPAGTYCNVLERVCQLVNNYNTAQYGQGIYDTQLGGRFGGNVAVSSISQYGNGNRICYTNYDCAALGGTCFNGYCARVAAKKQ